MWLRKLKPRFGLRTLLVLVTGVAILLGWGAHFVRKVRRTNEILAEFDSRYTSIGLGQCTILGVKTEWDTIPDWAWQIGGDAAFCDVRSYWFRGIEQQPNEADVCMLAELPKLSSLGFSDMALSANSIEFLSRIPSLERLDLTNVDVPSNGLARIGDLSKLRCLAILKCNNVRDADLELLEKLTNLERLELEDLRISSAGCRSIAALRRLRFLSLKDSDVDDDVIVRFSISSASLEHLNLKGTRITNAVLGTISHEVHLKKLNLADTTVTPDGVSQLTTLTELDELFVPVIDDSSGYQLLCQQLPRCRIFMQDARGRSTRITASVP